MNEYMELLEILGPVAQRAWDAYQKAKELAAKNGVAKEDIDAADARFMKPYTDPLAS